MMSTSKKLGGGRCPECLAVVSSKFEDQERTAVQPTALRERTLKLRIDAVRDQIQIG